MSSSTAVMATNANQELVERVIEVTGSGQAEAEHLLAACANDVEAAVALFFEQGTSADAVPQVVDADDNVRAPIAPKREQLIGPEDDNFYNPASGAATTATLPSSGRIARAAPRVKVCPLRDFAREGELMEEQLQAATSVDGFAPPRLNRANSSSEGSANATNTESHPNPPNRRKRPRTAGMINTENALAEIKSSSSSSSRLGDLFRPPTDIAYAGTFQTARIRANELKQWLLVNVQSDNFDSQVLNRDVWSDKEVRKILRRRFMLWQVNADTSEGRRFVTFYHCNVVPYICIIDPRTGEEVLKFSHTNQPKLLPDLKKFLREHKDFCQEIGDDCPTTSKRSSEIISIDYDGDGENSSADPTNKRAKVVELSEEEQIALAIRNSMRENGAKTASDDEEGGSDLGSVEEFGDDDAKNGFEKKSFEEYLGAAKNELTMLKLRLLNDNREDVVVELRWPSDTKLKALRAYIAQHYPNIPKKGYKLICAFPRKTLDGEDDNKTLKELSLHPSANLHVTLDD